MQSSSKTDIIRRLFDAYRSRDRQGVEALLADDFTFTSPYDDAIDKSTYFARCWPGNERIRSNDLEKICEAGDDAFVLYRCVTKDGKAFRNTEMFTFDGDRVREINVYFGATYQDGVFVRGGWHA